MTDESFMTDIDIAYKEFEEAMAAKEQHIEELSKEIDMLKKQLQELKIKG